MSNAVLVIGPSGSGKSTALRNLDPKSTFIINVLGKHLPFKGYRKNYKLLSKENPKGNYLASDNWRHIVRCIERINEERDDISTLVIDDWQYILSYEFMRRAEEKGYDKFSELAMHGWSTLNACISARPSLTVFILSHSDIDSVGVSKCKTIGKMLDEKITLEGLFTTVLHTRTIDGKYLFQTQFDGDHLAKSPIGMFGEPLVGNDLQSLENVEGALIPNDLQMVKETIENYYDGGKETNE